MANKRKVVKKIFLYGLLFCFISVAVLVTMFFVVGNSKALEIEKLETELNQTSFLDNSGNEIDRLSKQQTFEIASAPKHVTDAFVSIEDKSFYEHNGYNLKRMAKAAFTNFTTGKTKEGASTITQQLIKNTHLTNEKTFERKIQEVFLASKLEDVYSKEKILEKYLNIIYFGNGIVGLEKASKYYFSKDVSSLSISEGAMLAGIIKSPSNLCPVKNHEGCLNRRNLVLYEMKKDGKIDDKTYNKEKLKPLGLNINKTKNISNSYITAAASEAAEILNISIKDLYNYNYTVNTYYNEKEQALIDETVLQEDYTIKTNSNNNADCVVLSSDNSSYGITGFYSNFANAHQAKRTPASAVKPLLVFAPAIETGVVSSISMMNDKPANYGDYKPKNYSNKSVGNLTVKTALSTSNNIAAVKLYNYTGKERANAIAENMGVPNTGSHLSRALGNIDGGMTFSELASGYSALANQGVYKPLKFVESIINREGKVVYKRPSYNYRAIGDDTAYIVTDMLKTCALTGTAKKLNTLPFEVAAKTGTAQRDNATTNTDCYNVCYTPSKTLLVWHGNASMNPENDLAKGTTGSGITSFIARDIIEGVNKNNKTFIQPPSIELVSLDLIEYEKDKLVLANNFAPEKYVIKEYFSKRYKPEELSTNFIINTKPVLSIKLANKTPILTFETSVICDYEIYRNGVLLEVISGNNSQYVFEDKETLEPNEIYNYYVISKSKTLTVNNEEKSNICPIIIPDIQIRETKARGNRWFF